MADLLVVGTGLIGTSVALAVAGTRDVVLADPSGEALATAVGRGAGRRWDGSERAGLALVCAPPGAVAPVLVGLQRAGVAEAYSHVSSVQSPVARDLARLGADPRTLCGSHPMAGREVSGPSAARAGLFAGRAWAVCPDASTGPEAVEVVLDLVRACGAEPVRTTAEAHDAAVALVSHLPQVAASAVAARLTTAPAEVLALAGPGLLDTTRLAASPADLWAELLELNAAHVAPLLRALADDLSAVADGLAADDGRAVARDLVLRGGAGRARLPLKRGQGAGDFAAVVVDVPDRPGELVRLLTAAADAGVNVEDVRVDHLPGAPRGSISLLVAEAEGPHLRAVLRDAGHAVLDRS